MTTPLTSIRATSPDTPGAGPTPGASTRRHLYEMDLVRGLTMVGVIGVHTLSWTTTSSSVAAGGLMILLHFTRESFFTLMAFVLIFSYRQRPVTRRAFWAKRLPLVVVPYVVWTAIYLAITKGSLQLSAGRMTHLFISALVAGTAWYHLYFLLVTLQIYLLFPLILLLVQATRRHHGMLVIASLVLQLVAMSFAQYWTQPRGEVGTWLWNYRNSLVVSYQFFIVLGAVAACHVDDVLRWFESHLRVVWCGVGATMLVIECWYQLAVASGQTPGQAAGVFQPAEVLWSVAAIAGLVAAGVMWANARARGRGGRVIPMLSRHSFGIFLVHPLIINALVVLGFISMLRRHLPDLAAYVVVWPVVLSIAMGFAVFASRTPASVILTGRRRAPTR